MSELLLDFLNPNKRPSKNGWYTGFYFCRCRSCAKEFTGAKGAWICSDCAYDFDEQLQYESLWRNVGWVYAYKYVHDKAFGNKVK